MTNGQPLVRQAPGARIDDVLARIPTSELVGPPHVHEVHSRRKFCGYVIRYDLKRPACSPRRQNTIWLGHLTDAECESLRAQLAELYKPEPANPGLVLDDERIGILQSTINHGLKLAVKLSAATPFWFRGMRLRKRSRRTLRHG